MKAKLFFFSRDSLLEGPVWNELLNVLMCVSIEQERIYLINPSGHTIKTFPTKGQVGFAVFDDVNHIIYAAYNGVFRLNIHTGIEEFLFHLIEHKNIRYNDGCLDPYGRIILGTTGYKCLLENKNCVYSWDGNTSKTIISGTTISNGIAFSADNRYMFFVDTPTNRIARYIYKSNGDVEFDKYVISIEDQGSPDGIFLDSTGDLYVAQWGGYKVSIWDVNSGKKTGEISLPVKNVSSCAIGRNEKGKRVLYITTAKHDDGTASEEMAGGMFVYEL